MILVQWSCGVSVQYLVQQWVKWNSHGSPHVCTKATLLRSGELWKGNVKKSLNEVKHSQAFVGVCAVFQHHLYPGRILWLYQSRTVGSVHVALHPLGECECNGETEKMQTSCQDAVSGPDSGCCSVYWQPLLPQKPSWQGLLAWLRHPHSSRGAPGTVISKSIFFCHHTSVSWKEGTGCSVPPSHQRSWCVQLGGLWEGPHGRLHRETYRFYKAEIWGILFCV